MKPKFNVWIRETHGWDECGEGDLTELHAKRIAKEIRRECGVRTLIVPAGRELLEVKGMK